MIVKPPARAMELDARNYGVKAYSQADVFAAAAAGEDYSAQLNAAITDAVTRRLRLVLPGYTPIRSPVKPKKGLTFSGTHRDTCGLVLGHGGFPTYGSMPAFDCTRADMVRTVPGYESSTSPPCDADGFILNPAISGGRTVHLTDAWLIGNYWPPTRFRMQFEMRFDVHPTDGGDGLNVCAVGHRNAAVPLAYSHHCSMNLFRAGGVTKLRMYAGQQATPGTLVDSGALNTGTWYTVILEFSATYIRMTVNGTVYQVDQSVTYERRPLDEVLLGGDIGTFGYTTGQPSFTGRIKNVVVETYINGGTVNVHVPLTSDHWDGGANWKFYHGSVSNANHRGWGTFRCGAPWLGDGGSEIFISDLTVWGQTGGVGFHCDNMQGSVIKNVRVTQCRDGVRTLAYSYNGHWQDNLIDGTRYGFLVFNNTGYGAGVTGGSITQAEIGLAVGIDVAFSATGVWMFNNEYPVVCPADSVTLDKLWIFNETSYTNYKPLISLAGYAARVTNCWLARPAKGDSIVINGGGGGHTFTGNHYTTVNADPADRIVKVLGTPTEKSTIIGGYRNGQTGNNSPVPWTNDTDKVALVGVS